MFIVNKNKTMTHRQHRRDMARLAPCEVSRICPGEVIRAEALPVMRAGQAKGVFPPDPPAFVKVIRAQAPEK